jgi:hypothetical protein
MLQLRDIRIVPTYTPALNVYPYSSHQHQRDDLCPLAQVFVMGYRSENRRLQQQCT